jgi:hypothetical protein
VDFSIVAFRTPSIWPVVLCPRHGQRSDRNLENSNFKSLGSRLLLRQADMRQFRICEKGGRHEPITLGAGTVPENVVSKNPKIVQGRVGKLRSAAHIIYRPDTRDISL